nr:RodZ family helix-turn-helix domain-containing protein [uncultured Bacillus sp.]
MTEIGKRLKEARIVKGLSLDDLQSITKIQKRYLQGIEEGNYSLMPGNFYVRAFIKQYAEAVGLEPEALFEEFKNEVPSTTNDDLSGQLSRVQSRKIFSETSSKVLDILPMLLIGIFIVGAFAFVWYFMAQRDAGNSAGDPSPNDQEQVIYEESKDLTNEEQQKSQENADKDTSVDKKETKSAKEANDAKKEDTKKDNETKVKQELAVTQSQGDKSAYELKNAEKFELKLVSTGETWVNVKNGKGYSFFQGMLKKDGTNSQTFDLSQETDIIIVVGNTAATEIYVNDQKLDYAISPSDVVKQDIAIHYVKAELEK